MDDKKVSKKEMIVVRQQKGMKEVEIAKIICVDAVDSYVTYRIEGSDDVDGFTTLEEAEVVLKEKGFKRPHRSYLINPEKVVKYDWKTTLTLSKKIVRSIAEGDREKEFRTYWESQFFAVL